MKTNLRCYNRECNCYVGESNRFPNQCMMFPNVLVCSGVECRSGVGYRVVAHVILAMSVFIIVPLLWIIAAYMFPRIEVVIGKLLNWGMIAMGKVR